MLAWYIVSINLLRASDATKIIDRHEWELIFICQHGICGPSSNTSIGMEDQSTSSAGQGQTLQPTIRFSSRLHQPRRGSHFDHIFKSAYLQIHFLSNFRIDHNQMIIYVHPLCASLTHSRLIIPALCDFGD